MGNILQRSLMPPICQKALFNSNREEMKHHLLPPRWRPSCKNHSSWTWAESLQVRKLLHWENWTVSLKLQKRGETLHLHVFSLTAARVSVQSHTGEGSLLFFYFFLTCCYSTCRIFPRGTSGEVTFCSQTHKINRCGRSGLHEKLRVVKLSFASWLSWHISRTVSRSGGKTTLLYYCKLKEDVQA